MPSTIRISDSSKDILREVSKQENLPMQTVLEKAIENYRRYRLLENTNKAYAFLKKEPESWEEELKERKSWETTLSDGLEES